MIKKFLNETNRRISLLYAFLLLISLVNILNHKVDSKRNSFMKELFLSLGSSGQEQVSSINLSVQSFWDNYINLIDTKKKNTELEIQIKNLKHDIFQLQEVEAENQRLNLLISKSNEVIGQEKIYANIVSWDASDRYRILRINKGKDAGIKINDVVLSSEGLVGKVIRASSSFSEVLTLLDELMRVDVLNTGSREFGIVKGMGTLGEIELNYIDIDSDIKVADQLITSGLGVVYPKGIRVGRVESVIREPGKLNLKIILKPFTRFSKLEEVFILKRKKQ